MEKFQRHLHIKEERDVVTTQRIVKNSEAAPVTVSVFQFPQLSKRGDRVYSDVKKNYGPLALTDGDRGAVIKDGRFSLSPLIREPLALEEEERRAIQELVDSEVESRAKAACDKAQEEGYAAGHKQGYDDAYKQFQDENQPRTEFLETMIKNADAAKKAIFQANERFLMEMVLKIAKSVVLKEVQVDSQYLVRLAKEIVGKTGLRENIKIQLNPEDMASVEMVRQGMVASFGSVVNLNVEMNPNVERGGMLVDTAWNSVDAQLSTQLENLRHQLIPDSIGEDTH